MVPLPPAGERPVVAVGARRRVAGAPTAKEMVGILRRLGTEGKELVALFDADAIAGERHLLSAWAHLGRSRARGTARLRDRSAELALFVAGDDQLPRALAKVGFTDRTNGFVLVTERPRPVEPLLEALGLEADPTVYPRPVDEALLDRLGIGSEERAVLASSSWEGLVLERVALVDLGAVRHGEAPSSEKS
jgi:tRNA threonylcarbamoyladenosine modification (KEOPS) complex Cgi121 subunit